METNRAGRTVQDIRSARLTRTVQACLIAVVAAILVGCGSAGAVKPRTALPDDVPDVPPGSEIEAARAAFDTGNFGFAARFFEQAMRLEPDDMQACLGLAASYDWLYRFDLSDPVYATCSKIEGDRFLYLNNLGFSHLLRGDLGRASVSFGQANALRPGHPVVATNLRILRDAADG